MPTSIGAPDTTSPPARSRRLRNFLLATLCTLLLLILAATLALSFLDADWLKSKLQEQARASLDAELRIRSVEFSKWRGRAVLSGISLHRQTADETTDFACEKAEIEVALLPLIFRSVHVKRLELSAPDVTVTQSRAAGEEASTTIDKFKKWVKAANNRTRPIPGDSPKPARADWRIDTLLIHGGRFDYTLTRDGRPPFHAAATGIEYAAHGVAMDSLANLLAGADVTADLDMGARARLVKRATADPRTFALTGVDLGYADRLFNQSDALIVADGKMDILSSTGDAQKFRCQVKITGLRLANNPAVPDGEFLLVPVKRLIERSNARNHALDLAVDLNADQVLSDDLSFVVDHFTAGLFEAMAKELVKRHATTAPPNAD
jgi:uncharacterized protein involved in outer membrane biogenesis